MMKQLSLALAAAGLLAAFSSGAEPAFSPYVDQTGAIRVPENYRTDWDFLGTWSIAGQQPEGGAAEFHGVYTQPGTIAAFRATGRFPDGAVLVKELLTTDSADLTTGRVSWARTIKGWFVMIKDRQGRFPDSGLWGDGWGWAYFSADDPVNTATKDYRAECTACHVPARDTDWVYTQGYPVLQPQP